MVTKLLPANVKDANSYILAKNHMVTKQTISRYSGIVSYIVTIHSREMKGRGKNTMLESVF